MLSGDSFKVSDLKGYVTDLVRSFGDIVLWMRVQKGMLYNVITDIPQVNSCTWYLPRLLKRWQHDYHHSMTD